MAFLAQKLISASGATEATDDDFNLVTGLYHFDGSNGAQNKTFLDSSSNGFTVTRAGSSTQGTFSPFSAEEGKWSAQFTRSSLHNYIYPGSSSDFAFGTGDFTIECFCYLTGGGEASGNGLFAPTTGVVGPALGQWNTNGWQIYCGTSETNISNTSYPQNEWVHVAFVRASNVVNVYQNGVKVTSDISDSTNYTNTGFNIGWYYGTAYAWDGYISNFRVVKGTAVYTSAFTPPTEPLTAITNTVLLTLRSNRHVDISTSAHTMDNYNPPKIQPFSPFAPSAAYDASVNGGAFYGDGSGDYASIAASSDFDVLSNGTFTIDFWFYRINALGLYADYVGIFNGVSAGVLLYQYSTGFHVYINGSTIFNVTHPKLNEWVHVALTRDGTTLKLFLNGVLQGSSTASLGTSNYPLNVAGDSTGRAGVQGYVADVRVVKGTAVYTSAFTPPTAPSTAITNTEALLSFTNFAAFDQSGKTTVVTRANAQLDTGTKKFGTASLELDGTNDYLEITKGTFIPFGTGDFTVECFLNINSGTSSTGSNDAALMDCRASGTTANGFGLGLRPNGTTNFQLNFYTDGASNLDSQTMNYGTWYHVAISRSGSTIRFFVNGTTTTNITKSNNFSDNPDYVTIGASTNYVNSSITGFIDEFRLTLKARYTSNFTAPTKEFPNL